MAHASIIKNVCGGVPPPLTFSESVSLNKENDMSNFDTKELRQVFSQFPTGVTVITTRTADGEPIGVTASSFNTVSISPTLILWSIDKGARSLEAFKSCEYFAVNILSDKQIPISNRFAGRGQDKFGGINYTSGLGDAPLIPEALTQLQCKNWNVYEGGDHLIMVGEVVDYNVTPNARPLVFSQGSYSQASPHYDVSNTQQVEVLRQHEFLEDHILYLLRVSYNQLSQVFYDRLNEAAGVSPEVWRIYACLADGNPLELDTLGGFVMQPTRALSDALNSMGAHVQCDGDTAKLTEAGVQVACKLLAVEKQYKKELADRVGADQYDEMKETLRQLYSREKL